MSRTRRLQVSSWMWGALLASGLGVASVGADCGGSSSPASGGVSVQDASDDTGIEDLGDEHDDSGDAGEPLETGLSIGDAGGATDAFGTPPPGTADAAEAGRNSAARPDGCVLDFQPCGGGSCCNMVCSSGACGGCLGEGNACIGDTDCCSGLTCAHAGDAGSFCGTNLCAPDGTECGNGTPCCNDNCNNGTCGG
jgi:hypothetical protein